MLTKPSQLIKGTKVRNDVAEVAGCTWTEPFVLYYDEDCDDNSGNESKLKFTIQMRYDELI